MSENKDTEKTRELTETELNAVTGGATPKLYEAACKALISPKS